MSQNTTDRTPADQDAVRPQNSVCYGTEHWPADEPRGMFFVPRPETGTWIMVQNTDAIGHIEHDGLEYEVAWPFLHGSYEGKGHARDTQSMSIRTGRSDGPTMTLHLDPAGAWTTFEDAQMLLDAATGILATGNFRPGVETSLTLE